MWMLPFQYTLWNWVCAVCISVLHNWGNFFFFSNWLLKVKQLWGLPLGLPHTKSFESTSLFLLVSSVKLKLFFSSLRKGSESRVPRKCMCICVVCIWACVCVLMQIYTQTCKSHVTLACLRYCHHWSQHKHEAHRIWPLVINFTEAL